MSFQCHVPIVFPVLIGVKIENAKVAATKCWIFFFETNQIQHQKRNMIKVTQVYVYLGLFIMVLFKSSTAGHISLSSIDSPDALQWTDLLCTMSCKTVPNLSL